MAKNGWSPSAKKILNFVEGLRIVASVIHLDLSGLGIGTDLRMGANQKCDRATNLDKILVSHIERLSDGERSYS